MRTYLAHRGVHVQDLLGCGHSIVSSGVCGVAFLPEKLSTREKGERERREERRRGEKVERKGRKRRRK